MQLYKILYVCMYICIYICYIYILVCVCETSTYEYTVLLQFWLGGSITLSLSQIHNSFDLVSHHTNMCHASYECGLICTYEITSSRHHLWHQHKTARPQTTFFIMPNDLL